MDYIRSPGPRVLPALGSLTPGSGYLRNDRIINVRVGNNDPSPTISKTEDDDRNVFVIEHRVP